MISNITEERLALRTMVWQSLDRLLSLIPRRHPLLLLGDLNVRLPRQVPLVPCSDPCGRVSDDRADVIALLESHDLVVRNERSGHAGITYQNQSTYPPKSGSRIDYCVIRRCMRSCCSTVRILWDVPFLVPNDFGWHALLRGEVDLRWRSWRQHHTPKERLIIDKSLIAAAQAPEHPAHGEFLRKLSNHLCGASTGDFDVVNKLVLKCSLEVFGRAPSPKPQPHWMNEQVRLLCLQKWRSFHGVRSLSTPSSLRSFFGCWRSVSKMLRDGKLYKHACRQARSSWLNGVCEEAATRAANHDPKFFHLLRRLSPKRPFKAAGIRKMLSGAPTLHDEGHLLRVYFSELFGAPPNLPTLMPKPWTWLSSCPPNEHILAEYLAKLPMHKAAPPGHAMGAAWRLALLVPQVRSSIYTMVVHLPSNGVKQTFRDGSLILLPKSGKSGKQVEHFRPLVLQCPLGKMLLKWFVDQLVLQIRDRLLATPQFAYLSGTQYAYGYPSHRDLP